VIKEKLLTGMCVLNVFLLSTILVFWILTIGDVKQTGWAQGYAVMPRSGQCSNSQTPLQFLKERVHVKLSDGQATVKGWYYIRNGLPQSQDVFLYYPFAINEHQGPPVEVKISEPVLEKSVQGFSFLVHLNPCRARWVKVSYKQPLYGEQFTYILTTTARWGRALEQASFRIKVPVGWEDVSVSYPADRVRTQGTSKIYTIKRRDFLPKQDLEVRWSTRE